MVQQGIAPCSELFRMVRKGFCPTNTSFIMLLILYPNFSPYTLENTTLDACLLYISMSEEGMLIFSYKYCNADDLGVAPPLQAVQASMRGASHEKIVGC